MLLIGTGPMAVEYAKVLAAQDVPFRVVGRGEESALNFFKLTGIMPVIGGLEKYLTNQQLFNEPAIVATGTEMLMACLLQLTAAGCRAILIEKPAAISIAELLKNEENLRPFLDYIFVAYNRRFYSSVIEVQKLIEEDGGVRSLHFEFTEWAHRIGPLQKPDGVKQNWFFANSTHVVDLAFFLAGRPNELACFSKAGSIDWHKTSNFSGAGVTEKGVLFSYISNWESAGRWSIELMTEKRRLFLCPLETVQIQKRGELTKLDHPTNNTLDISFKPGLYAQVDNFVRPSAPSNTLLTLRDHLHNCKNIYLPMLGIKHSG